MDAEGNVLGQESFGGQASPGVTTSHGITLAGDGTVMVDDDGGGGPAVCDVNADGQVDSRDVDARGRTGGSRP